MAKKKTRDIARIRAKPQCEEFSFSKLKDRFGKNRKNHPSGKTILQNEDEETEPWHPWLGRIRSKLHTLYKLKNKLNH